MKIKELNLHNMTQGKKLMLAYSQLDRLLTALRLKDIPKEIILAINDEIEELNSVMDSEKGIRKHIKKAQSNILGILEKSAKLVTINHYRNYWLVLGMAVFGIPIGIAFGTSIGNMAFMATGIPMGMTIGITIGVELDKKAKREGKQIDLEIKNEI